jgi:dTDP-glucose 4,6-dehydratase
MVLVTGGAGFIGSNFVLDWTLQSAEPVLVLDCLSYAGNLANLDPVSAGQRFDAQVGFARVDLRDAEAVRQLVLTHSPRAIVHFAAESHVDRSIAGPGDFIQTNVVGTFNLLQAARELYGRRASEEAFLRKFRFLHVSTDEVYGSLGPLDPPFRETTPYAPNSPYSASKAASDHLVRAWHHTYGLPTLITNCSNNYGPLQFPEKLIPLVISHAIQGQALPVYGDGANVRDWLFVLDHCRAIRQVLEAGRLGEVYNIGGGAELDNLRVVHAICDTLDQRHPRSDRKPYRDQVSFVRDRPGHDRRYAIDSSKIRRELGWQPTETFSSGLSKTIDWFLENQSWVKAIEERRLEFPCATRR